MRAVALTVIGFIYIFSISMWVVDAAILSHTTVSPRGLDGTVIDTDLLVNNGSEGLRQSGSDALNPIDQNGTAIDRIGGFALAGYTTAWTVIELLSGTYAFNTLERIGLPSEFVLALKLIFPMLVAVQVLYWITGRSN